MTYHLKIISASSDTNKSESFDGNGEVLRGPKDSGSHYLLMQSIITIFCWCQLAAEFLEPSGRSLEKELKRVRWTCVRLTISRSVQPRFGLASITQVVCTAELTQNAEQQVSGHLALSRSWLHDMLVWGSCLYDSFREIVFNEMQDCLDNDVAFCQSKDQSTTSNTDTESFSNFGRTTRPINPKSSDQSDRLKVK